MTFEANKCTTLNYALVAVYAVEIALQKQLKWLKLKAKDAHNSSWTNASSVTNVRKAAPETQLKAQFSTS
jgi:hypothetical protein